MIIKPLNKKLEKKLFEFMNQDGIRHFWGIYDLQHMEEKVNTWIALSGETVIGYLMEIKDKIIHLRGIAECAVPLLRESELPEPLFNIEPSHFSGVKKLYEHFKPTELSSKGEITTFLSMKVSSREFKPVGTAGVRVVGKEDFDVVSNLLGRQPDTVRNLTQRLAYGLFEHGQLVSFAAAPEMIENLAIVRGVYTMPALRGKGYATKVCSAVTQRLIGQGKEVLLYVSNENQPALSVYRKLGFRETGHVFLSFFAEKRLAGT